jgi:hypothetical protein
MLLRLVVLTSAGFALGVPMSSSNTKVDEMCAKVGLWSGTNDEMVAKLANLPLEAQLGTLFRHGMQQEQPETIIWRIIGEGLDVFLERRIFRSLHMKDSDSGVPETSVAASRRVTH